jgi:hypothetical protein
MLLLLPLVLLLSARVNRCFGGVKRRPPALMLLLLLLLLLLLSISVN